MGITKKDCEFLFHCKSIGVSFSKVLTLGRLLLYVNKSEIEILMKKYGNLNVTMEATSKSKYSEPLFKILGATKVESLDYSNYEGASIIHDLNYPINNNLHQSNTCVVDSGTLEHVFDFPTAIRNAMNMVAIGGHYIGITPTNNQMGHGFYQFSPELYYRIFSEENGFVMRRMLITSLEAEGEWYEVSDPKEAGGRGMVVNNKPLCLMMVAQKVQQVTPFVKAPVQSDYASTWQKQETLIKSKSQQESRLLFLYRKMTPKFFKRVLRNIYDIVTKDKQTSPDLGIIDMVHFKKFNF